MLLSCHSCKLEINPSASNPKDQELLCNKCEKYFHKKCTDRKKATAHWRKQPWYCNECIAGTQEELSSPPAPNSPPLSQASLQQNRPGPSSTVVSTASLAASLSPTSTSLPSIHNPISNAARLHPVPPAGQHTVLQASQGTHRLRSGAPAFTPHHTQPSGVSPIAVPQPTVPSNAQVATTVTGNFHRQRSSNINVRDPDKEFLQTALDSCRSTIVQNESEIKKLKEAMDIRNKRILQLEAQISFSASQVASGTAQNITTGSAADKSTNSLLQSLSKIEDKLHNLSNPVSNIHVHNNISGSTIPSKAILQDTSSQTDPVSLYPSQLNENLVDDPTESLPSHPIHTSNLSNSASAPTGAPTTGESSASLSLPSTQTQTASSPSATEAL